MSYKLQFPSFSVVFIQTFSIRHELEFIQPDFCEARMREERELEKEGKKLPRYFQKYKAGDKEKKRYFEKADYLKVPIARVDRGNIEDQIFILPENSPHEKVRLGWWQVLSRTGLRRQPIPGNVQRYSLRGFNFVMPINMDKKDPEAEVRLSGHCCVEMNLFYGHLASITYRFLFDNDLCKTTRPVDSDHIIAFLSTWLNGEFWSKDDGNLEATIDLFADFDVTRIWLDANGDPLDKPQRINNDPGKVGRSFNNVAVRYKRYIYKHCTRFRYWNHFIENHRLRKYFSEFPVSVDEDFHYAMVDLGGDDIRHPMPSGKDLFDQQAGPGLTDTEIREHIRTEHKAELMGLLSLYPKEWPYRDPADFEEVCGGNIAIDSDDLVLVGSSVALVLGTYVKRDEKSGGVDWEAVLEERARYHVYWPEYLMLLQMILAKKYILGYVADQLVLSTLEWERRRPERMLEDNAALSVRLMRLLAQLDVVKYAKFPSHKVMYDRTCARLGISESQERTNTLIGNLESGLNNLKDLQTARRETMMNISLGMVSVLSAFQFLYIADTKLGFWEFMKGLPSGATSRTGAVIITVVAAVAVFVLIHICITFVSQLINRFRK